MSVIESIQGLTPILAIPLYAEQQATAQRLQAHGIAWQLPYEELSYDGILYGIRKLTSGSYKANLRQLKKQLHYQQDGSQMPKIAHYLQLALDNADFLKSHARNHLNYFRAESLDVSALIALGIALIVAIPFTVTCCILRKSHQRENQALQYRLLLQQSSRPTQQGGPVAASLKRSRSFAGVEYLANCEQQGEQVLRRRLSLNSSQHSGEDGSSSETSESSLSLSNGRHSLDIANNI